MILFFLPFLFSPSSLVANWLPAIYLAIWPIIIQTAGRETLLTHALVLIMFILTCDITRQTMLKLIGFDLISFPAGIALLAALATDQGSVFLSLARPLFSGVLMLAEPVFLLIEIYLVMDMIRIFNKWISTLANVRDEEAHDLSTWEPPLARSAIIARIIVISITVLCYIGVYMITQESKSLLGTGEDVPINFNHAIAALVTLQLIAFSATIYKEEGVLSESAMVALLASVPIFIASWSYYHLHERAQTNSSSWTSYFPFSIFGPSGDDDGELTAGAGKQQQLLFNVDANNRLFDHDFSSSSSSSSTGAAHHIDFGLLEESLNRMANVDGIPKQLLLALLRRLIMLINSILGLSMDKLAKYYFGPDFWYILAGRLACVSWWALSALRSQQQHSAVPGSDQWLSNIMTGADGFGATQQQQPAAAALATSWARAKELRRSFAARLPLSMRTLVKVLFVLAYAQMLIQQMDNRHHLKEQVGFLTAEVRHSHADSELDESSGCCGGQQQHAASFLATDAGHRRAAGSRLATSDDNANNEESDLSAWFNCMWTSAKACSGGGRRAAAEHAALQPTTVQSRAARFIQLIREHLGQLLSSLLAGLLYLYQRLASLISSLHSAYALWFARRRSPIIQRLGQSMLVQLYYIGALLFVYE